MNNEHIFDEEILGNKYNKHVHSKSHNQKFNNRCICYYLAFCSKKNMQEFKFDDKELKGAYWANKETVESKFLKDSQRLKIYNNTYNFVKTHPV